MVPHLFRQLLYTYCSLGQTMAIVMQNWTMMTCCCCYLFVRDKTFLMLQFLVVANWYLIKSHFSTDFLSSQLNKVLVGETTRNILACLLCRLLCQHISFNNTSAIIKIKLVNVVWDPNRAGQKLQLQLFFSCWLIQTKIDLTPERFYVRNKCRLLESTHGESKKGTHRNACVHIFPFSSSDC